MKKHLHSLLRAFLFVAAVAMLSCASPNPRVPSEDHATPSGGIDSIDPDSIITDEDFEKAKFELNTNADVTAPTEDIQVVIHGTPKDYGDSEDFAFLAAELLERVVNSVEFKRAVLNPKNKYLHDNGLSPEEIYDLIRNGREAVGPGGSDRVLDFRLRTITVETDGQIWIDACNKTTIGKDGGTSGVTATCFNWIVKRETEGTPSYLAGHYMHEYLHMLGFKHPGETKYKSVPYQIGYMVRDLGTNYGKPLSGTVTPDQKFETIIDGTKRQLVIYKSGKHVPKLERLDLSKKIGKAIMVRVSSYSDSEAYGGVIVQKEM